MRVFPGNHFGTGAAGLLLSSGVPRQRQRAKLVLVAIAVTSVALLGRAGYLQAGKGDFLRDEGEARYVRTVNSHAPRGVIRDRHGTELAMSTAVESIWVDPPKAMSDRDRWPELAAALGLTLSELEDKLLPRAERSFVYVKRHADPETASRALSLGISGVHAEREYRRYYPEAEVAAHVVGFANINGEGQEGAEFAYDSILRGQSGAKQVLKDRKGRIVEDVQNVRSARPGRDVYLTIDLALQSLAYRALKAAVVHHQALAGTVVVADARTGEIHALANQPSYNPNNLTMRLGPATRNRAATDMFEPGSTMKPFAVMAGLESGSIRADSIIDTSPGYFRVGRNVVRDRRDLGDLDLASVIKLSSNVGVSRIALDVPPERLWNTYVSVGFGSTTGSRAVGESPGTLRRSRQFGAFERATLSFGYGVAVTALQLVRAYTVFANDGKRVDLRLARDESGPPDDARSVVSPETARELLASLETVVEAKDGTGRRARIPGYRVAGKTGTSRKAIRGGYAKRRYLSLFAGLAPVSDPKFVAVVVIDEPRGKKFYGGEVAAPVFRTVMSDALRLNAVPPDSTRTPPRDAVRENYASFVDFHG